MPIQSEPLSPIDLITFSQVQEKPLDKKECLPGVTVIGVSPLFELPIKGEILNVYENSACIQIINVAPINLKKKESDQIVAINKNNRVIIPFNTIYPDDKARVKLDNIDNKVDQHKNKLATFYQTRKKLVNRIKQTELMIERRKKDIANLREASIALEKSVGDKSAQLKALVENWKKQRPQDGQHATATTTHLQLTENNTRLNKLEKMNNDDKKLIRTTEVELGQMRFTEDRLNAEVEALTKLQKEQKTKARNNVKSTTAAS